MRNCGNCNWSISKELEEELRNEYIGENYDEDSNTLKAGDCCLAKEKNKYFYCNSHDFEKNSNIYYLYENSLNIKEIMSIDIFDSIYDTWISLKEDLNISYDKLFSYIFKTIYGGEIRKTCNNNYYNYCNKKNYGISKNFEYDFLDEKINEYDFIEHNDKKKIIDKFKENLIFSTEQRIENSDVILNNMDFLKKLFTFSDIEIEDYESDGIVEKVTFSLEMTTTGNIFRYSHNLLTDKYDYIISPCMFTLNGDYIGFDKEFNKEFLKGIFELGRDLKQEIKVLRKI